MKKLMPKNKKGDAGYLILFIVLLFIVVFVGFIMVTGSSIVNWVWDEAVPELDDLGMVGDANATQIASYTLTPLNNIIQSFTWLTGVIYILMLIASIGIAFTVKMTPNKWLIGFYFLLVFVLVIGCMFMSNIYEDFYDDSGELGDRLKEHTLLSWMILYSPMIMVVIAFVTGAILFSGQREESFI